jgi:teichuronic acid biosynthesis glycosyltransferase TuaC
MRILFLSQVFPDDRASVRGTFNLALCNALSVEHKVRIVSPRPWTEVLTRKWKRQGAVTSGAVLEQSALTAEYPTYWYVPRIALHRTGQAMLRSVRRPVQRMLEEFRPDAVLSYWAHPEGRVGLELGRELGIPSACIVGGSDVLLLPNQDRRRRREIVRVLTESDAIITVSDGLRHACTQLGAAPGKVRTIYQGVDRATFFPRDQVASRRKLRIPVGVTAYLWVGRMVKLKRLDVALEAVAQLHHGGKRVKLYLLGDGPDRSRIEEYSQELGLHSVVDFVGPVATADLPEWYSAADATVLCSDSEGLPNVLRESLACGTPFVATNVGSIGEFALPDCSRLVPAGDATALAVAMTEVLQPGFRVAAGLHRARTWSDCARETAELLDSMSRLRAAQAAAVLAPVSPPPVPQARPVTPPPRPGKRATADVLKAGLSGRGDSTTGGAPVEDVMEALNRRLHAAGPTERGGVR